MLLHNLDEQPVTVDIGPQPGQGGEPREELSDTAYPAAGRALTGLELGPYGYRWIRRRRGLTD